MRERNEHLEWSKQRAREYLARGDLANAIASMLSDLSEHPDFRDTTKLGMIGLFYAMKNDADGVRRWIEGWR